jgi:hypothetical protein
MNSNSHNSVFLSIFSSDNAEARLVWILHWYNAPKEGASDSIFEVLAFNAGRHWQDNDVWICRKLYNVEQVVHIVGNAYLNGEVRTLLIRVNILNKITSC